MSELEFRIEAPCKIMLHGEVAESFGKTAVVAAGNLKTVLTLSVPQDQPDNEIHLLLTDSDVKYIFNIKELRKFLLKEPLPLRKRSSLIRSMNLDDPDRLDFQALLERVARYEEMLDVSEEQEKSVFTFLSLISGMFSCVSVPLEKFLVKVSTEIPPCTGLGASASFSTCVAAALLHLIRLRVRSQEEMSRVGYKSLRPWCTDFNSFDEKEKRIICRWASLSDRGVSTDMSEVGPTICTYGAIISYKKLGTCLSNVKVLPQPKILKILLIRTGINADTCDIDSKFLQERYSVVVDPIFSAIDELSIAVSQILKCVGSLNLSEKSEISTLLKVLFHEIDHLGELTNLSQSLLKTIGMSHPKVDIMLQQARRHGLRGKLIGYEGVYAYLLLSPFVEEAKLVSMKKELLRASFEYIEVRIGVPGVTVSNM